MRPSCHGGSKDPPLHNGWGAGAEVAAEDRHRGGAEPIVQNPRVDRPEVGLIPHIAAVVLESRIAQIGIERRRCSIDAAAHRTADRHHHGRRAMIGAAASVLRNPATKLRELQDQRFREQPLVAKIVVERGDTIAVWGCGPVGQFAIKSAFLLGAERLIAIDTVPERLALAQASGAVTLDFKKEDIYDRIQEMTNGRGADACIDAVGTEPDIGSGFDAVVDRIKVATFMGTDRPHVLRQAIHCCRNFGTVSIVGVYGGLLDKIPMGSAINRGLTFRMAQTPVQHYLPQLLGRIEKGEIDPSFVITHRATLEEGPELYKTFRAKQDGCIKVVMKP